LRLGELVGAVSGLGLLVVTFLPWFSAGQVDLTAWQAFTVVDLVLVAAVIMSLSVAVVMITGLSVSYPVAGSAIATGAGLLAFVLVLIRLIEPPGGSGVEREAGVWLGLLACAGIVLGGYLGMQEPNSG
jgi:hypothetical protein